MKNRLFTSESVTEGHPDKIADQISDAIVDSLLSQDANSRVAVETLITTGQVHVAGEVTTDGYADVMNIVRDTVLEIGYNSSDKGLMAIVVVFQYRLDSNHKILRKGLMMLLKVEFRHPLIHWICRVQVIKV